MDITPIDNSTQPISDDQELAKALAGVMPDSLEPETPAIPEIGGVDTTVVTDTTTNDPQTQNLVIPTIPTETPIDDTTKVNNLEDIKLDALKELRPLMDKVDIPADEKFNTYLMLIRSTDDSTLIAPAHTAAQNISDEKQRAEALLEIIKEIDYLSHKDGQQTA